MHFSVGQLMILMTNLAVRCPMHLQALSSKYFQVGQNLNIPQPITIPRPSQPVAPPSQSVAPPLRNRPSITNLNHKFSSTSVTSTSSKYTDARQADSKEALVQKRESKDSWSLESVSPAPGMPSPVARKRSDWKAPKPSLQEDKVPWEGQKRQLGSIRESPVEPATHGRRSRVNPVVPTKRAQDLADLDSILSEFDNTSLKKNTR